MLIFFLVDEGNLLHECLQITLRSLAFASAIEIYSGQCNMWKSCFWKAPVSWRVERFYVNSIFSAEYQPLFHCEAPTHCKILPSYFCWSPQVLSPVGLSKHYLFSKYCHPVLLYSVPSWVMLLHCKDSTVCKDAWKWQLSTPGASSTYPLNQFLSTLKLSPCQPLTNHPLWPIVSR